MKTVEIEVKVVGRTQAAVRVDFGGKEEVWIPKSQIEDYTGPSEDRATSIFIPEWLAKEKGMV